MYFYELHEGDDDLFSDLLLAREEEMDPELFFETVQSIRRRVQDSFEQDTLIEAIADILGREHGFIVVSDDRLSAAVNVSRLDDDNFLAELESGDGSLADPEADGDEIDDGYVSILADFQEGVRRPN